MKTFKGNMFDVCNTGDALCVTTNGTINIAGNLVMGAGVAKEFRDKFRGIDSKLGKFVKKYGNRVFYLGTATVNEKTVSIFSFPTKEDWRNGSDINIITKSARELQMCVKKFDIKGNVYLPAPGCGLGGLDWELNVKSAINNYLKEDKFVICFKE